MKKRTSKQRTAGRRSRVLILAAVAAVIVVAAATVISRQHARATQAAKPAKEQTKAASAPTFVTRRVGNQEIKINTQNGEIQPLTQEEAQRLANGLAPMLDRSADGLRQVKQVDGSVSMDLEGRFQNVTVARVNADGSVEQSCVDNPAAAAKFFRIDRKLIENAPTARKKTQD